MKDLPLVMITAEKVAKKKFSKKNVSEGDINILSEIYEFFFKYIDNLTLDLPIKKKKEIWNKNTINLCFKTYLYKNHNFKVSNELLKKISNQ